MASESTPILSGNRPSISVSNLNCNRSKWMSNSLCCLYSLLIIILVIIVLTVFYSVNQAIDSPTRLNDSLLTPDMYNVTWPIDDQLNLSWNESVPNWGDIDNATTFAVKSISKRASYERTLPKMNVDSPSYRHQISMKTTERARELMKFGLILEMSTKCLAKRFNVSSDDHSKHLIGLWSLNNTKWLPLGICNTESVEDCLRSPYRTLDGSCNNLNHSKTWGVAMKPFRRILPPNYADGISSPREASEGSLPSARAVSLTIHRALYVRDLDFTVMLAVWGQFIDHDMTATALSVGINGGHLSCCNSEQAAHPECFVVRLGPEDPFYKDYNVTCMEFVRSAPAPLCRFGPREQLNQASSFLDGSAIYGNNRKLMNSLRSFNMGSLKMLAGPGGEELLPVSLDLKDGCNREEQFKRGRYCFLTGDLRSNENLHLTAMHLIFARQHNSVARRLSVLNAHWNDEKLFQETRKIVAAQIQHITYKEFLPAVLPPDLMDYLNLTLQSTGYFYNYNETVNPTVANAFAASVFRFGHSLLPGLMKIISNDSSSEEYVELHKMLFNPFGLYDGDFLEKIIRGALHTSAQKSDEYFSNEVTQKLFKSDNNEKEPCGLDLVSLNIQRGRDHGLPGYPEWRKHCGLRGINSFDDLNGVFDADSFHKIKHLYKSVEDVDLFTGGLAEIPVNGSLLGPTFTCLLADQFLRLKIGDRYWYESEEQPQAFTRAQLTEIRKTSLAKIICQHSHIERAQPMVMRRFGENNQRKLCEELPSPRWEMWKESPKNV